MQIARRLRAMIENLIQTLPAVISIILRGYNLPELRTPKAWADILVNFKANYD